MAGKAKASGKRKPKLTAKKLGVGLEIRSFMDDHDIHYLVFKSYNGTYHVFAEVEAKEAALRLGAKPKTDNTQSLWNTLWKKKR